MTENSVSLCQPQTSIKKLTCDCVFVSFSYQLYFNEMDALFCCDECFSVYRVTATKLPFYNFQTTLNTDMKGELN